MGTVMARAVLYVLACPVPGETSAGTPGYLLHEVGGVPCVVGYTGLDKLAECCGQYQPWAAIPMGALMADLRDQGLPGPVVNLPLDESVRWGADGPPWDLGVLASGRGASGDGRGVGQAADAGVGRAGGAS
jgi:hypothetical protein